LGKRLAAIVVDKFARERRGVRLVLPDDEDDD
jgi:hypothetical protein